MDNISKNTESASAFPTGLNNAFIFATFNALSYPLVLGSPMLLYARTLGASATVLGLLTGMMPLLVIFQIPAARHVERVGYKRFVYAGWGTRVAFIFAMALVPLMGNFLDATNQLVLLLVLLFAFNLSRGISSCAWLPWVTSLVPPAVRGRYLSVDAACVNFASFLITVVAALGLGAAPDPWQFAALFAISGVMGAASLVFLKRIPDVALPEQTRGSSEPVPWREFMAFAPFRKLLQMNFGWALAYGGLSAFTVVWLKAEAHMTEGSVLLVTSVAFLGGLSSLWLLGARLDRVGSKPVLTFAMLLWIVLAGLWCALAGGVLAPTRGVVLTLQFCMGLAVSSFGMANTRLAMAIIPVMGRSHFFALSSVVANLTLGISPVVWGLLLDASSPLRGDVQGLKINNFTLFFAAVAVIFGVTLGLCRRLEEPKAVSMEALLRELLIESPQRAWVRFWPR